MPPADGGLQRRRPLPASQQPTARAETVSSASGLQTRSRPHSWRPQREQRQAFFKTSFRHLICPSSVRLTEL